MNKVSQSWEERTPLLSKIERLNFSADRKWTTGTLTITGKDDTQKFNINVFVDGQLYKEENFSLKMYEQKVIPLVINRKASITVTGSLQRNAAFSAAGGLVELSCEYDPTEVLKEESVSWQDSTAGTSCLERLFLSPTHKWEHCEVFVQGHKNTHANCRLTLLVNGEELWFLPDITLLGTESKQFTLPIGKQAPLLLVGYLSNELVGAHVTITLKGFYKP